MAYFYKHIKGMATDLSIHKIEWSTTSETPTIEDVPSFKITSQNNKEVDFGKIIVTGTGDTAQTIETPLTINGEFIVGGDYAFSGSNGKLTATEMLEFESSNIVIGNNSKTRIADNTITTTKITGESGGLNLQYSSMDTYTKVCLNQSNATLNKPFVVSDYCEAVYFNATSDKRAKTNIKPITLSALDYINSIPVYSFDYIQNNKPSIGIMAQDVLSQPIADFNLVENKDASGDGDFMSIRESKLVYILWKAVQELSAEVKELKEQLNK